MTEQTPQPNSLAERALARLRKLAAGNGMEPAAIISFETQEQTFTLNGRMDVSPLCETETQSYPGPARGKDRRMVKSIGDLQNAVTKHQNDFRSSRDWVEETRRELQTQKSSGWGLESAKVTLPQKSAIYAATEVCPSCSGRQSLTCEQCQGRGTVICTQCQGQGREQCYYCAGRGEDPQQPGQKCHTCQGTRFAQCRFCLAHGYLPCPTCNGQRGVPCRNCQATGRLTQEVAVICGAKTRFVFQAEGLPSGLRRGLDRIGIANLDQGHAVIAAAAPDKQQEEVPQAQSENIPVLSYQAEIPYAELRLSFGVKKGVVSAVGKRCVLTGVPNFLEGPLQPYREKLRLAVAGQGALESAVEARALNEILSLIVAGQGHERDVRRLYPFGLSSETIMSLLSGLRLALNKTTFTLRAVISALCVLLSSGLFFLLFNAGWEQQIARGWGRSADAAFDLALLSLTLCASWALLNFSTRFVLQRRFPHMKMAVHQKIGKTGYTMLGSIAVAFFAFLFFAPYKPVWLLSLYLR